MKNEILNGELTYPGTTVLELYPEKADAINKMWRALWVAYLNESDLNGIYWYEQLGCEVFNDVVRRACHNGWVISNAIKARRWASLEINTDKLLEYVTEDEIERVKAEYKYDKYLLERKQAKSSSLVRQNGVTRQTGLVRTGFRDSGNTQFGYDMDALNKYEEAIKLNLTKSMDKIRKNYPEMKASNSSYDNVSVAIYDWHYDNQMETFTTGENINDSRGRAISDGLRKVANPISSKDFRSALVITYED